MTAPPTATRRPPRASRRGLSVRQLEFLAIGSAIGSGLFVGSSQGLHEAGPALLVAYAVCALPIYLIARCLGELALAYPGQGNFVDHVRWQLGRRAGFVSGWSFWIALVLIGMAELTAASLLGRLWLPQVPQWIVVALMLAMLLAFNTAPASLFGTAEIWMSSVKIAAIAVFVLLGLLAVAAPRALGLEQAHLSNLWRPGGLFPTGWRGFRSVLPVALFSFGGFELISLAAAETADPDRALPRAINGLIVRFVIFYLGATAALLVLLPWTEMVPGTSPFVVVLQRLDVPFAAGLLNLVLITAVLSSCNALIFGAARALAALARAAEAPSLLGGLNRRGAPGAAVLFTVAAISLAVLLNSVIPRQVFGLLMEAVSLISALNWGLIVLAELRFRRRPGGTPRFALPWTPWTNLLVLAFIVAVVAVMASDPGFRLVVVLVLAALGGLAALSGPLRLRRATLHEVPRPRR